MKPIDYQIRDIYRLDNKIDRIWVQIKSHLSSENIELFEKYETEMINFGLAKATRIKQLQILFTITKKINKNWVCVTKSDIDRLVREIVDEYSDVNGDETETSRDFKILESGILSPTIGFLPFLPGFRLLWSKGSREYVIFSES